MADHWLCKMWEILGPMWVPARLPRAALALLKTREVLDPHRLFAIVESVDEALEKQFPGSMLLIAPK